MVNLDFLKKSQINLTVPFINNINRCLYRMLELVSIRRSLSSILIPKTETRDETILLQFRESEKEREVDGESEVV